VDCGSSTMIMRKVKGRKRSVNGSRKRAVRRKPGDWRSGMRLWEWEREEAHKMLVNGSYARRKRMTRGSRISQTVSFAKAVVGESLHYANNKEFLRREEAVACRMLEQVEQT